MKTNILAEKNSLVSDLETRLSSASEENFTLSAKIKDALSEHEKQKNYREWKGLLLRWREKRRMLSNRIESAKMESNYVEAEMVGKVDSLQVKW